MALFEFNCRSAFPVVRMFVFETILSTITNPSSPALILRNAKVFEAEQTRLVVHNETVWVERQQYMPVS